MRLSVHQEDQLLTAFTQAPLALAKWFRDGTLVFASDEGFTKLGIDLRAGLAKSYQQQFADSPALVNAIAQAFKGHLVSDTVRVNSTPLDVRFFPVYDFDKKLSGVIGILSDASDRITAFRLVRALEVLSLIRKHLAGSDTTEEFLRNVCQTIEDIFAGVWIGLANHGEKKTLQVITGRVPRSNYFETEEVSWDSWHKDGRNPASEAIRTGRTQLVEDIELSTDCRQWHSAAREHGWKSLLAVPLLSEGVVAGVMTVYCTDNDAMAFDREVIDLWEKIGGEITEGIGLLSKRGEYKRLLLERQESDNKYRQLVETAFDVVVIHRHGKIVEINPAGVQLAGAQLREELIGTPLKALVDKDDRARVEQIIILNNRIQPREMIEFRLLALNASVIDVEGVSVPCPYNGAQAQLTVLRDISQRKYHEAAISKAKASLEYAQQVANIGSIEFDVIDGSTEWSKNARTILHIDEDRSTLSFADAITSWVLAEDKQVVPSLVEQIRRTGKEASAEFRIMLPESASEKTIRIHGVPTVLKHEVVPRIFFVVNDVSEIRRVAGDLDVAKQRLHQIQAIGRMGDFIIHWQEQKIDISECAWRVFGTERSRAVMSLDVFYRQFHPEDRPILIERISELLTDGVENSIGSPQLGSSSQRQCCIDCRLIVPHSVQWVNVCVDVLGESNNYKIFGNIQDITARKLAELEKEDIKEALHEAHRLARAWEWSYTVEGDTMTWSKDLAVRLGFEPPMKMHTYEQLLTTIRDSDRESVRQAAANTLKHGVPGEAEYVQNMPAGGTAHVFSRWVAERDEKGKITCVNGTSIDVTYLREYQVRSDHKSRVHAKTGLAEKEMAIDRICYLSEQAKRFGRGFTILGIKVQEYRAMREQMGVTEFYQAQVEIAAAINKEFISLDIIARLDKGRFLFMFGQSFADDEVQTKTKKILHLWESALSSRGHGDSGPVRINTCSVRSPEDGVESEGLLKLIEHKLEMCDSQGGVNGTDKQ